jgi:hypothetical protein
MEQRVAGKDHSLVSILHVPADAVLRVARRVQGFHQDAAKGAALVVARSPRHGVRVLACDDGEGVGEFGELERL